MFSQRKFVNSNYFFFIILNKAINVILSKTEESSHKKIKKQLKTYLLIITLKTLIQRIMPPKEQINKSKRSFLRLSSKQENKQAEQEFQLIDQSEITQALASEEDFRSFVRFHS